MTMANMITDAARIIFNMFDFFVKKIPIKLDNEAIANKLVKINRK